MNSRALLVVLGCCAVLGCTSSSSSPPPPRESPDAPSDAPGSTTTPAREPARTAPGELASATDGGPALHVEEWKDETQGPTTTLVYVTEQVGRDGQVGPAAIVLSSDPANAHFKRKSSSRVTVHRLQRADMGALMVDLDSGLRQLPWVGQPGEQAIGPERALYLFEGGQGRASRKETLSEEGKRTFTAVERRLIQETARSHGDRWSGPDPERLPGR